MLNATFSVIFKHCVLVISSMQEKGQSISWTLWYNLLKNINEASKLFPLVIRLSRGSRAAFYQKNALFLSKEFWRQPGDTVYENQSKSLMIFKLQFILRQNSFDFDLFVPKNSNISMQNGKKKLRETFWLIFNHSV